MSHNSPRSQRVKQEARARADVLWREGAKIHEKKLTPATSPNVLSGGTELAKLIAQSDAIMSKMRKIVH